MYRKLDEKMIENLLECGVDEFAEHGLDRANINVIAKKAGVSVGVIYKYYNDKDSFFLDCVRHSLRLLDHVMEDGDDISLECCLRSLIHKLIENSEKHRNYIMMYNEITSGSCRKYASELAAEIESPMTEIYKRLIAKAQRETGRKFICDQRMFTFCIDSLLMMLHFSISCEYYRERMKIYMGNDIFERMDELEENFVRMLCRCFGLEESSEGGKEQGEDI